MSQHRTMKDLRDAYSKAAKAVKDGEWRVASIWFETASTICAEWNRAMVAAQRKEQNDV